MRFTRRDRGLRLWRPLRSPSGQNPRRGLGNPAHPGSPPSSRARSWRCTTSCEEFDEDGSGNIDATELRNILEHVCRVSSQEIQFFLIDDPANGGNGDGLVSEDEFLNLLASNGKNILADVTRNRAQAVAERRQQLEAAKLKKINDKLEAERKSNELFEKQQLADEAERLRQANENKARQVAEYNQREAARQLGRIAAGR